MRPVLRPGAAIHPRDTDPTVLVSDPRPLLGSKLGFVIRGLMSCKENSLGAVLQFTFLACHASQAFAAGGSRGGGSGKEEAVYGAPPVPAAGQRRKQRERGRGVRRRSEEEAAAERRRRRRRSRDSCLRSRQVGSSS